MSKRSHRTREKLAFKLDQLPVKQLRNPEQGLKTVVEFGGGIGKGDSPSDKRANLEGIVKKTFRNSKNAPDTFSVINAASLEATLAHFA